MTACRRWPRARPLRAPVPPELAPTDPKRQLISPVRDIYLPGVDLRSTLQNPQVRQDPALPGRLWQQGADLRSSGYVNTPIPRYLEPVFLYGNRPLGPVEWRARNGTFCQVGYLLANARRSSAARNLSAWSREVRQRSAGPSSAVGNRRCTSCPSTAAPAPAHSSIAILTTPAARTVHSPGKKSFLKFSDGGLNRSPRACRNSYIWPDGYRISTFSAASILESTTVRRIGCRIP